MNDKGHVALIFPPHGDLYFPYLSLPSLTAYLREQGHKVLQLDLGVETFDTLLSKDFLESIYKKNVSTLDVLASKKQKSKEERRHLYLLAGAGRSSEFVLKNIELAKRILRDRKLFFSPQHYSLAREVIGHAFRIISAAYFPTEVLKNRTVFAGGLTFDNIVRLIEDYEQNPFLEILKGLVDNLTGQYNLKFAGISITYYSQVVGGFTIARLLKMLDRNLHVSMGGAVISEGSRRITGDPRYFELADSYVFGEGEKALDFLATHYEELPSLRSDPPGNILLRKNKEPRHGSLSYALEVEKEEIDINGLPSPDFTGLPLDRYLSPDVVFPISCSRGCYWRKCSFCSISVSSCPTFKMRSPRHVKEDLNGLMKKYDARYFFFTDNAVTPRHLSEIAEFFSSSTNDVAWTGMVRLEKEFTLELLKKLRRGGCLQLLFGQESANERVLNLIRKGTLVSDSKKIIKDAHAAGIAVGLMNIIGFPTETEEEADQTIDFLVKNKPFIYTTTLTLFDIRENSPVHNNPRDFAISYMRMKDKKDLYPKFYFSTEEGMTRKQASQKCETGKQVLLKAYPWCGLFLDEAAHSLLYLSHVGYEGFTATLESLLLYFFFDQLHQ